MNWNMVRRHKPRADRPDLWRIAARGREENAGPSPFRFSAPTNYYSGRA